MKKIRKSPALIFICGTVVAALIAGLSLLFLNEPQCPADWYQTGVTDCATGANIGLGIATALAIGVWIIFILMSLIVYARTTLAKKDKPADKR